LGVVIADDYGHLLADQISHQSRQPIRVIFRRAVFDRNILPLDETCFLQALAERGHEARRVGKRRTAQEANHRHRGLLRARSERPCDRRAGNCFDEIASSYCLP